MLRYFSLLAVILLAFTACDPSTTDDDQMVVDTFDRGEMLRKWAYDFSSSYEGYKGHLEFLLVDAQRFKSEPTQANYRLLQNAFDDAYFGWQNVDPVLVGKAEEIRLRARSNTYPTDPELITENIAAGTTINLALPSMTTAQGLPALDYLIYGIDRELLAQSAYSDYLIRLIEELTNLLEVAASDFTQNRTAYVANDGSSATASIDRTVNDYIFYYEKFLRAGKVGIPAGVFSDDPLADRAESLYGGKSKFLLVTALRRTHSFFNNGLFEYLNFREVRRDGELLSGLINDQFRVIETGLDNVGDDFAEQVQTDNAQMLALYDEMQRLVVLLKVDMLQALNINVDYVDADGD